MNTEKREGIMILVTKRNTLVYIRLNDKLVRIKGKTQFDYNEIGDTITFIKFAHFAPGRKGKFAIKKTVNKPSLDGEYQIAWNTGWVTKLDDITTIVNVYSLVFLTFFIIAGYLSYLVTAQNEIVACVFGVLFLIAFSFFIVSILVSEFIERVYIRPNFVEYARRVNASELKLIKKYGI